MHVDKVGVQVKGLVCMCVPRIVQALYYTRCHNYIYREMASSSAQGGYEHEFIDAVRDDHICQICQLPARDPQQTTCCGKVYCKSCINRMLPSSHPYSPLHHHSYSLSLSLHSSSNCPNCRSNIQYFPDKASDRRIKELKVKCDNHKNGCKWKQELAQLEEHLSKCGYVEVICMNNCKQFVLQHNLSNHLQNQCPMREYQCPKCKEKGKYQTITTDHLKVCLEHRITCPNPGCGVRYKRKNTLPHISTCQRKKIKCDYSKIGCAHESCRDEMAEHISESTEHHLKLAMQQLATQTCPTVIKMDKFQIHKDTSATWYSPPFYSHPRGYKMCLKVYANGIGDDEDTYVSVYLYMMRGENDDNLVWPFQGEVTLTLLNQLEDKDHKEFMISYDEEDNNSRVTDGERGGTGWGVSKFISHEELGHRADTNCQYLKDDSLYFRVSVKVHEACKPWLIPTT